MNDGQQISAGSGARAVVAMFAVALAAAAFAWWWNFQRGQRALEFYGPEAATLIRTAPKVELLRNEEPVRDISKAKGLLNARTSLLGDAGYDWNREASFVNFDASLRFTAGNQSVTVFFDFENRSIEIACSDKRVTLSQKTAAGWRNYLERQLGEEKLTPLGPKRTDLSE